MELVDTILSNIDNTVKYVFKLDDGKIMEIAYINKNDGKDILCVPSQTACCLRCKFCHTSDQPDFMLKNLRNLRASEIVAGVERAFEEERLARRQRMLLVSYMGCGEPLLNWEQVFGSMTAIAIKYHPCRFALATILPMPGRGWQYLFNLAAKVWEANLQLKVHLSLHFTKDEQRKEWMPSAAPIMPSISALQFFRHIGGGSVEIHYTMIKGVNDGVDDAARLALLVRDKGIPVKLIQYNPREKSSSEPSSKPMVEMFIRELERNGVEYEWYVPPGRDVGASCGQFMFDYYERYAKE
jgi:23S rRNA (adenine2503-C2)-methyltransferase